MAGSSDSTIDSPYYLTQQEVNLCCQRVKTQQSIWIESWPPEEKGVLIKLGDYVKAQLQISSYYVFVDTGEEAFPDGKGGFVDKNGVSPVLSYIAPKQSITVPIRARDAKQQV